MKILIVSRGKPCNKYPINGIFEQDQAKSLAKNGNEVMFLALDFRPFWIKRKWGFFHIKEDQLDYYTLSIPIGRYRKSISILQFFLDFAYKRITSTKGKPDIVHAHFYFISVIASVLKRKYKIPLVVTEHAASMIYDLSDINKRDVKLLKKSFQNADRILSVSPILQQNIKRKFGYNSNVVYNTVNTDSFKYHSRKQKNDFYFLSVGNLLDRKGFDLLIESFSMSNFDKNVHLNIIGEGDEHEKLQSIIDNHKLSNQVKLLGIKSRKEIQEFMELSDAFVLASKAETFGVVYIEAMLTGLPIIATKCGGPEYFTSEENGILVAKNNIKLLSLALIKMRNTAYDYDSKKISDTCYERFSPDTIAKELMREYNVLVNESKYEQKLPNNF